MPKTSHNGKNILMEYFSQHPGATSTLPRQHSNPTTIGKTYTTTNATATRNLKLQAKAPQGSAASLKSGENVYPTQVPKQIPKRIILTPGNVAPGRPMSVKIGNV